MPISAPVRFSADLETFQPDEPQTIESLNETFDKILDKTANDWFSVWTGLAAHQPLGNINRARKAPYEHSANFRAGFNRCPIHEPQQ